jgi:hypothetical protein
MSGDGYDHPAARYRAMVFRGPEAMAAAEASVTAAMDATFGVRHYTTTEGWLVGGLEGNGEVNMDGPQSSPAWRLRIDKARREIAEHKDHIEWRDQVDVAHRVWPSEDVSGLIEFIKGQY